MNRERQRVVAAHRQRLRHACRRDLRQRVQPLEQLVEEGDAVMVTPGRSTFGSATRKASTCSGWKPGSTLVSRAKLRSSSAAPTSSTIDIATSDDEQRAAQPAAAGAVDDRPPSLSTEPIVRARRLPRRREAEEDAGREGDDQREEQERRRRSRCR